MKKDIKDFYKWIGKGATFRFYGMSEDEIRETSVYKKWKKRKK